MDTLRSPDSLLRLVLTLPLTLGPNPRCPRLLCPSISLISPLLYSRLSSILSMLTSFHCFFGAFLFSATASHRDRRYRKSLGGDLDKGYAAPPTCPRANRTDWRRIMLRCEVTAIFELQVRTVMTRRSTACNGWLRFRINLDFRRTPLTASGNGRASRELGHDFGE